MYGSVPLVTGPRAAKEVEDDQAITEPTAIRGNGRCDGNWSGGWKTTCR